MLKKSWLVRRRTLDFHAERGGGGLGEALLPLSVQTLKQWGRVQGAEGWRQRWEAGAWEYRVGIGRQDGALLIEFTRTIQDLGKFI